MRRLLLCALLATTSLVATGQAGQSQSAPEDGWSGTATVRRHGSGPVGPAGQGVHEEEITFTFRPDGTASYTAHYEWRVAVPQYAPLRAWGRESGETTWSLGYVEIPSDGIARAACAAVLGAAQCRGGWEIGVGGVMVPGTYDSTSVAQVLADWFVNALQAPELRQAMPPVLESDGHMVEGFGDMVQIGATTRTLSGGDTRTIQPHTMQNFVPLTEQVTWSLTKGRVDPEPRVTIYGPPCGCLDADDPSGTTLVFTAGATRRGGQFSEFVVTPAGTAPEVLANDPGDTARLELSATKDTGPVTLSIRYELNGRRYEARPFRVEFCAMKAVELDDNQTDLAFDSSRNELIVKARQEAWYNGQESNSRVRWEIDKIGASTTLRSDPSSAQGERITFTYATLPEKNSDFGPKVLTAAVKEGQCACTRTRTVRAFFEADGTGNPNGNVPNWYYYWKQSGAVPDEARRMSMEFRSFIPMDPLSPTGGTVAARWDGAAEQLLIGSPAADACAMPMTEALPHVRSGRDAAEGIDCFAELVRHELQHRQDFIEWWGSPKGPHAITRAEWLLRDNDVDLVPNAVEATEAGCKSGLPTADNKHSCDARPTPNLPDAEIRAYYVGWSWPLGSINAQDWSCGGVSPKQWKGTTCR